MTVSMPSGIHRFHPIIEVSPNLMDWYSGGNYTTILRNETSVLQVRDNTPLIYGTKRYIRLKPEYP